MVDSDSNVFYLAAPLQGEQSFWEAKCWVVFGGHLSYFFRIVVGVKVNLRQKLLFLHQLTYNMTTDCSLNYKFNT